MWVPVWELRNSNSRLYPSSLRVDQGRNWVFGDPGKFGMALDIVKERSMGFTVIKQMFVKVKYLWKVKYCFCKILNVPTAYVLLNSDLGSDESIIGEVKKILSDENLAYEVQGVYGVYDIVLKLSSEDAEQLRSIITNKIRKISKVQSTLTMMVVEEQENL